MWLQAFEALGPQVYINIPLCVEWSLIWVPTDRCVRWTQLTGSQGLKEIVPRFLHHASQCRPSGRVMCGAGRCSCDLSWPWRKRVGRLYWKAWHFWDCFQSPAWGLFQVRFFTPPFCKAALPLWPESVCLLKCLNYQKVPYDRSGPHLRGDTLQHNSTGHQR